MRKRRGTAFYLVLAVIAVLGVQWGVNRWPTGPAAGGPLVPPGVETKSATSPTTAPARLKLASFNIHSGVGTDRKKDLDRTARLLAPYDLVAMQEVSGDYPWQENQADDLGRRLGVASLFSPTERHYGFPVFGNGVLTRTPVDSWVRTPLPVGYHMANRQMLHLVVPFGDQKLNVIMVHLGKKSDRRRQFGLVAAAFMALPEPAVLMGDLNTRPEDRMITKLIADGTVRDWVGEAVQPVDRVDFILTRGLKCVGAGRVENDASDHPLIWAEIEAMQ